MADVVIVVGARRGHESVSAAEIRQMVGRAGRRHGGAVCEAYVLVDSEDYDDVKSGMAEAKFEVSSAMVSCDDLVFHLVPGICSGEVSDEVDAARWYARSLGASQGRKPSLEKAFERLVECGAVEATPLGYVPTKMAHVASELYFHPADVKAWRDNFWSLFEMGLEGNDAAVAWALGSAPFAEAPGDFGDHRFVMGEFKDELPGELDAEPGTVAKSTLWWSALGGPSVGRMRNRMLELRRDFGRVSLALLRLDEIEGWGKERFILKLEERMKRGIPSRLVELCSIEGMTKSRADYLYNAGVRDRRGIKEFLPSVMEDEVDAGFMEVLRRAANGVC